MVTLAVLLTLIPMTMLRRHMKRFIFTLAVSSLLALPMTASAASISGILLHAADDFGNLNGGRSFEGDPQGQLWRTAVGGEWHGLGVWAALPPQSLSVPPLNGPDFMVEIPLIDGENDFTLLGQPGSNTRVDDYLRFAIHLYFDGVLDHPGISVIFPRDNDPNGSPTAPSRASIIYSLSMTEVKFAPQSVYDDGVVAVSVLTASFVPPEKFGAEFDLVQAYRLAPSGLGDPNGGDYIGVLRVMVEPSANPAEQVPRGPGAQGFGVIPGGVASSGTVHGPNIPVGDAPRVVGEPKLGSEPAVNPLRGDARAGTPASDVTIASGEAEPTTAAGETPTPGGTPSPGRTPTSRGTVSPTVGSRATPSPATTATGATPTPKQSTTHAAATPTPGHGAQ